jgi:hypothetical protein
VVKAEDVNTVADELKDELGPASAQVGATTAHARDPADGLPPVAAGLDGPEDAGQLTERVERLEKTLTVVLNTLRRLVRVIEPAARHGN